MYLHKTVLVSCHIIHSPQAIPLAAAILKTYQPYKKEVEVILKDFYLNDTPLKAAESILKCNPDSIGFSMYIWNRDFLAKTAAIVKETNNNIIIYAGGAEITASALSLIDDNNFDYLVRGEGELPFVLLLKYLLGKDNVKPDKLLK
ncbi:MAG: cobalamin-dependent protein, partial [Spirochaetota bacterium]|nr:cobalamin-dependent protein [Spirochaetota bacterium]